jgi:hypothetical protein
MTHWIDLTTEQLRILRIAIPDHTKEWEHMVKVVEKLDRHLEVANMR